ncbi:MAG: hypothetical protein MZW92_07930 [Comamonadaceae bacterium]|nr:hypothetical protein [Comamonadaceae bacterium]
MRCRAALFMSGAKKRNAARLVLFGAVHSRVGVGQERVDLHAVLREDGDADARREQEFAPVRRKGFAETAHQLVGHERRLAGIVEIGDRGHELVTAEPACYVLLPQRLLDPASNLGEHRVAGVMAHRVVDRLEMIQIDEQDRDAGAAPASAADGPPQHLPQQ